ncbi:DNA-binding transcriptional ArsR family regulator [Virgibacillus halotolerans]|uniref:ArsR/SmtB family transcription factor n=1 Tax=Virgibacillus halotolerans TaxID=1071053 RepID=UPI00196007BF|nr:helix-turn-helix domain-containing protein [Virgibacillus halotolerans]MBM7601105.1 DNA-binding transcriptional ArsR family regulator [Virgibacillus halotolerans]
MDQKNKHKHDVMEVNWEQQKVLSNPLRSRLVALLYEQPMTPKQAADLVGKNPGTVYYHIQQLLKHDILEVESVNTEKGIVEKFYRAKATSFKNPEKVSPPGYVDGKTANVYLSKKLVAQLSEELEDLFFKYGHLSYKEKDSEEQLPYSIELLIKESNEEEEK